MNASLTAAAATLLPCDVITFGRVSITIWRCNNIGEGLLLLVPVAFVAQRSLVGSSSSPELGKTEASYNVFSIEPVLSNQNSNLFSFLQIEICLNDTTTANKACIVTCCSATGGTICFDRVSLRDWDGPDLDPILDFNGVRACLAESYAIQFMRELVSRSSCQKLTQNINMQVNVCTYVSIYSITCNIGVINFVLSFLIDRPLSL